MGVGDEHSETTIEAILGDARPRETFMRLCVAGDLAGELDRLLAERAGLARTSLAGEGIAELEAAIADTRRRMAERTFEFHLRALPPKEWSDLMAAHPAPDRDKAFNVETYPPALVAACVVTPAMTEGQAAELMASLNHGGREALFEAAWAVNTGAVPVPFSGSG